MNIKHIKVLLIEDDPGDAGLIRETLAEVRGDRFDLECVERLSTGLERLSIGGIDVILLDLGLPDSLGLDTFIEVHAQAPEVPIVVLTGLDDETLAVKALQKGAQEYLIKENVNSSMLARVLRYSIERHRLLAALRSLSLVDDLTSLYNRRGFFTLAEQHLSLAHRTKRGLLLVYADLDGLKQINDSFGHQEGDLALITVAEILRATFRASDIVARLGGDEFAVLAIETPGASAEILATRLQQNLEAHNTSRNRRYKLSLSVGIARHEPEHPCSIDELLARADVLMYEHKQSKRKP